MANTKKAAKKATARKAPAARRVALADLKPVHIRVNNLTGEALSAALQTPDGEARIAEAIRRSLEQPVPRYNEACRADFSNLAGFRGAEAIPALSPTEELQKRVAGLTDDLQLARAEAAALRAQVAQLRIDLARAQGYIDRVNEGQPEVLPMILRTGPKVSTT